MTQILDGARKFTTDSGPSQPISVCDRGKGASQVRGESCQDTDETAPVENCGATRGRNLQRKQKLLKHHSQRVSRMQRSMQASERVVSTWFTSIPMTKYGFQLNKHALFEIWLDAREVALTLPMWGGVLSGTCLQLSERTLAFNQA